MKGFVLSVWNVFVFVLFLYVHFAYIKPCALHNDFLKTNQAMCFERLIFKTLCTFSTALQITTGYEFHFACLAKVFAEHHHVESC